MKDRFPLTFVREKKSNVCWMLLTHMITCCRYVTANKYYIINTVIGQVLKGNMNNGVNVLILHTESLIYVVILFM